MVELFQLLENKSFSRLTQMMKQKQDGPGRGWQREWECSARVLGGLSGQRVRGLELQLIDAPKGFAQTGSRYATVM